ncbi:MAG: stage V sporulation T C-terminal domain-containing protein, partial [Peptostreptococcaceae bacterium]
MKATGIIRRIDDLGRIVIPKEIRKTLRIREGDPLEIFTAKNGEVILKKYSLIGQLRELAQDYAETLGETLGHGIVITDLDSIIAISKLSEKEYKGKQIST